MELKFEELPYQLDAVNAVANLFAGQPNHARTFDLTSQGTGRFVGNGLDLDWETLGRNLNAVQKQNGQSETKIGAHGLNFLWKWKRVRAKPMSICARFTN